MNAPLDNEVRAVFHQMVSTRVVDYAVELADGTMGALLN
jgi:hypothetical protein